MVDLKVLESMGSSQERLKQIFTAEPPANRTDADRDSKESIGEMSDDCKLRQMFETDISNRFSTEIRYAMDNYHVYGAVDLAWDCPPITKETYPLLLFAQDKLDVGKCACSLSGLPCEDKYVAKDDRGNPIAINLPKFFEVNFNLVRSVITRRLAAQANKYLSLYPHYKYEARSTSQVGKLRADIMSQVMDIMTDQFDLRHHDVQVMRDTMLYGHCIDFIRSKWETEYQTIFDPNINPDLVDKNKPAYKPVVVKEGVGWVNPHPTRVFWDNSRPLSLINSDTGPEFIGFWDVVRFGSIANNTKYWNRTGVTYSSSIAYLFSTYAQYFSQYYTVINPPFDKDTMDIAGSNDRLNAMWYYNTTQEDSSMIIANYYKKIIPKDWGIGDYPDPVWLRMVVAGEKTVVYAEFLPSSPAVYCGINENDSRLMNLSIAMELIPYQDQMTQLLSLLLYTIQSGNIRVLCVDIDTSTPEMVKQFRRDVEAQNRYPVCQVFEYSSIKFKELGINPRSVMEMVQTQPSAAITMIFQAMAQLVQLSERLMALSPHELGQPAPREITATETNMMAGTTETIYGFISDAIDEFRAAKKRVLYESFMVCGNSNVRVPVMNRYSKKVIELAGFAIVEEDQDPTEFLVDDGTPKRQTVMGTKSKLNYEYIFSSRDGALRSVNTQSANVLVQLLGSVLSNPQVMPAIRKEKLYEIVNEVFRLSGAGVDLKLELQEGESETMGVDPQNQQLQQVLQQLKQQVEAGAQADKQIEGKLIETANVVQELVGVVRDLKNKPQAPPIPDLIKAAEAQQRMQIREAEAAQGIRHKEQSHAVDTAIKVMKPLAINESQPM